MTEKEIFAKCLQLGMTEAGAAGATANILAESAGRPDNVEDSHNRKLGISDAEYVKQVDAGTRDFLSPAGGFGYCQWTRRDRRKNLKEYLDGRGLSIADSNGQFQFMAREMRTSFPHCWLVMTTTKSPYEAGYVMCAEYEIPDNTVATAKVRGNRAEQIYKRCAGTEPATDPVGKDTDVPTKTEFWPPRMICLGMEGADVSVLQAILAARGYYTYAISGIFDGTTKEATLKFQGDHALAKDAIVGPLTWGELLKK